MGFAGNLIEYFIRNPLIFIGLFILYFLVAGLYLYFTTPKTGRNPFKYDSRKPPSPLVTDKIQRDKVLKQGFTAKRIPEDLDVIIIGSGMGGLASAVTLAKAGKKVLILEQHDQAGGCCHTYEEKGFEFDVGIHYVGQLRNNTLVKIYIEQITDGQLQWCDLIEDFDIIAIGEPGKQRFYPFHAGGKEAWKKALLEKFPEEEAALDKFLYLINQVHRNVSGMLMLKALPRAWAKILAKTGLVNWYTRYFEYSKKSLQQVLEALTKNKDLQTVLGYSFGDYGTPPYEGSFAMHAMLINHYLYGASYPRGGASEIAFHMIPIIERAGGRVLVRAPVKQIVVQNGKATGVVVSKGGEDVTISAPIIISDAGVPNTLKRLLPKEIAEKTYQWQHLKSGKVCNGMGAMSVFVGLNGTTEDLKLKPQNIWAFTDNDLNKIHKTYFNLSADEVANTPVPLLFISFPSSKDPTYNDRYPGKTVCTIVTLARWDWYEQWKDTTHNRRESDYESLKDAVGRRVWEQTLEIFPQLRDKVEYFEVGSPVTNQFYLGSDRGEIYGLDHTVSRFGNPEVVLDMRPATGIPGLFLTGQDVMNCGFAGAAFGGLLCAGQVLNRNVYEDLVKLKIQLKEKMSQSNDKKKQ